MDKKNRITENEQEIRENIRRRLVQTIIGLVVIFAVLCLSAWTFTWKWGLIYFGLNILVMIINSIVLPREVIAERGSRKENVKQWDKILTWIGMLPSFGMIIVAGLDYRFDWTKEPGMLIHSIGIIIFILGNALFTWAMCSNKFFSTRVRLQFDRGHKVETGGPYKIVRHPSYIGYMLFSLASPLIMGSYWSLIPAAVFIPFFIVRTALEDATLLRELDGYKDYAKKVRYRMIPGIW